MEILLSDIGKVELGSILQEFHLDLDIFKRNELRLFLDADPIGFDYEKLETSFSKGEEDFRVQMVFPTMEIDGITILEPFVVIANFAQQKEVKVIFDITDLVGYNVSELSIDEITVGFNSRLSSIASKHNLKFSLV